MRVAAIVIAIAALLFPVLPTVWSRFFVEGGLNGFFWLVVTAAGLFLSVVLSATAFGIGREAYLDLRPPRRLWRGVELALLALPGALSCIVALAVLAYFLI